MGIPGITREIIKKYPDIANDSVPVPPDLLCLDFNPIIYNAYGIIAGNAAAGNAATGTGTPDVESQIIATVILELLSLLEFVFGETHKDRTNVFLAIDGTAPYAKIKQQRERRYKKAMHALLLAGPPEIFDTSFIIPGTPFMDKLSTALLDSTELKSRYNIIFSNHTSPGEGEHKILQYLRGNEPQKNVCVYSNDGDMLVLLNRGGLTTGNVSIISDTKGSSSDTIRAFKTKYFSIDITRFAALLLKEIKSVSLSEYAIIDSTDSDSDDDTAPAFCVSDQSVMDDFIFFMSVAGNDFVKPIPFTKMRERDTFNILINVYSGILSRRKHNFTVTGDSFAYVNYEFLVEFFLGLAKLEKYKMNVIATNVAKTMNAPSPKRPSVSDPKEVLEHTMLYSKAHPLFQVYQKDFAHVYCTSDTHPARKEKYYNYFFGETPVAVVVYEYLRSMIFTFKYYTDKVPSWTYAYPYRAAPLPSDIVNVLRGMSHDKYKKLFTFVMGDVFPRRVQLLLALPRDKLALLDPQLLRITMNRSVQSKYPDYTNIHIDAVAEHKFIYCEPILPEFSVSDIQKLHELSST